SQQSSQPWRKWPPVPQRGGLTVLVGLCGRAGSTNPIRGYPTRSNPFGSGCQPYPQRSGLSAER
ncbi:hypothetical protein PIB30_111046, partial [Stylosanthes scabra]|nr:hypothetical protein [Stylosanthes scabra]